MTMLLFMPWCPIDKEYHVGEITILPFERHAVMNGLDDATQCRVSTIMATYKNIEGKPVQKAAMVHYQAKSPVEDLSDDEIDIARDLVALACFCGLAKREYFSNLGPYCNTDCFSLYIQKFDKADFTALTVRRREGWTQNVQPIDDIAITIPVHAHTVREVNMDEVLLKALAAHREQSKNGEWGRWQSAISCFNQANTDNDNVSHQTEWVLLCGAFERGLGAESKARDVANKFCEAVVPKETLVTSSANRRSDRWMDGDKSLRYEWMREFYRIRGDFAHGRLVTQQPLVWNPLEHLVLAAIAFPLVIKSLLSRDGKYELSDDDESQINSFERFCDTHDFLRPPADQKNNLDSHWKRLVLECSNDIAAQRAFDSAWKNLTPEQQQALGDSSEYSQDTE